MRLVDVFDRHGCDRGSSRHRYDRLYEVAPSPARLLEIGIFKGAGIASWLEWFPNADIVGVDTFQRVPPEKIAILNHPRVTWFKGDSRTVELSGKFDWIIDDGCHDAAVQLATFRHLYPMLAEGGRYFIEDVWPGKPGYDELRQALNGAILHDFKQKQDSFILEIHDA